MSLLKKSTTTANERSDTPRKRGRERKEQHHVIDFCCIVIPWDHKGGGYLISVAVNHSFVAHTFLFPPQSQQCEGSTINSGFKKQIFYFWGVWFSVRIRGRRKKKKGRQKKGEVQHMMIRRKARVVAAATFVACTLLLLRFGAWPGSGRRQHGEEEKVSRREAYPLVWEHIHTASGRGGGESGVVFFFFDIMYSRQNARMGR